MYLSPRLAGSRARSCEESGEKRRERVKRASGAAAPPPRPRTHLHEDLHGALGDVQVAGAQIRPLVHGGGRVYEEEEDRHGPGRAPARRAPCGEEGRGGEGGSGSLTPPGRPPVRPPRLSSGSAPAAAAAARY